MYEDQHADLLAHPEVIDVPAIQLEERRVRVAEIAGDVVGFSALLPQGDRIWEVDGLFVEPEQWGAGVGRALMNDAVDLARREGVRLLEVTANPNAQGFYAKLGFAGTGTVQTQFGPGIRMRCAVTPKL